MAIRPRTRLYGRIISAKPIPISVWIPDLGGTLIHHPITIVVDAITGLGGTGRHQRVQVVAVAIRLRKPVAIGIDSSLGQVLAGVDVTGTCKDEASTPKSSPLGVLHQPSPLFSDTLSCPFKALG
jgi:hypothetical protein